MTLEECKRRLDHLLDYVCVITDIKSSCKFDSWSDNKWSLPSFDYYMENVIDNPGGEYDFTRRIFKSHWFVETYFPDIKVGEKIIKGQKVRKNVEYSYWKYIPFNFKENIQVLCE